MKLNARAGRAFPVLKTGPLRNVLPKVTLSLKDQYYSGCSAAMEPCRGAAPISGSHRGRCYQIPALRSVFIQDLLNRGIVPQLDKKSLVCMRCCAASERGGFMRRFLTLVCLLGVAIPAGISISGCVRNPAGN